MTVLPINQPQPNVTSQHATACKALLLDPATHVWLIAAAGAPASGEGNGWLGKGSLVLDATNGNLYQQDGTLAATTFSIFESSGDALVQPVTPAITAHAGGGKGSATAITAYGFAQITVCATTADSVLLPAAKAGKSIIVANDGAAAAQVFGQGTDTIDAVATGTGVVLTNAKRDLFFCVVDGAWLSLEGVKSV